MQTLIEKYSPKTDVIYVNDASASSYIYYSSLYKFNTEAYECGIHSKMDKKEVEELLSNFSSDKNYWFYLIKDYQSAQIFPILLEWISKQDVLFKQQKRNSCLIYFRKL